MHTRSLNKIVVWALAFSLFSCNDFLEETNYSGLTADRYYATQAGMESLINTCYTPMRFWYGKENGLALTETGTDVMTRGNGLENPPVAEYNSELRGANAPLAFYWERFYAALNACNTAIGRIGASPLSEELKKTREGEARFLRAFYLWHIVETWGGVHFTTEETNGLILTANRTPVEKFYEQIFEDLRIATENLPAATSDYGRVTKPAAEAFLARMHLTRKNYSEASRLAKKVISDYNYKLVPSFSELWNINNIKNTEAIFVVNFTTDLILNREIDETIGDNSSSLTIRDGGNNSHMMFLMTYDQLPGMQRSIDYGRPFARIMPTTYLLDLFDETKDSRFVTTFQSVWASNKPGTYKVNNGDTKQDEKEVTFKSGDTAIYATKYVIPKEARIAKKYTVLDRSKTYNTDGTIKVRDRYMSLKKFLDPTRLTISQQQGKRDAFVLRLAEMYLIVAEAEMNLGNLDEGTTYFNAVRKRAALPGKESDMLITADDLTIDAILDERAREFVGEQLRWFDLKRTGKLLERVRLYNPDAKNNIQDYHLVRPIPQVQLDAVTNKSEFFQNEGYQ
ncbi:RagB/SusD family nutrient uptake outer membrane protein [Cytophagaceae bacterium DM2B3-1]|uniref:RagB/SusD family nutrient uptake outer membrane protein n=1 Tax=Xanthocytophaga flava TaxID=3048013 RepID=A0ABT7CXI7_9BACT|nr:RagB/SusD family nutrient uptake outer membrane protein [Xanthocytophaga flavus]MDJ1466769.1 RagB/SusD family nutrient uptake outer membrane protein [Xanthocytophaga flavus]MDJ1498445.1 RagB/SusD family nutrient uptake outer membrane protein [Xanthocytophaga flavus]